MQHRISSSHWLQHNELQTIDRKWSRQSVRYLSTFAWRHTVSIWKPRSLRYSPFLDQYLKPGPPENAEACSITARPCIVIWQYPDVTSVTISFAETALDWKRDSCHLQLTATVLRRSCNICAAALASSEPATLQQTADWLHQLHGAESFLRSPKKKKIPAFYKNRRFITVFTKA